MRRGTIGLTAAFVAAVILPTAAQAQFATITNRAFGIDPYVGIAVGSARLIAMGGVSVADAEGSVGTLANAAAAAVPSTTDPAWFRWDWHLDWMVGLADADIDNNGRADGGASRYVTAGLSLTFGRWAGALSGSVRSEALGPIGSVSTTDGKLSVATVLSDRFGVTVGAGLRVLATAFTPSARELFRLEALVADVGVAWTPTSYPVRVGMGASSPGFVTKVATVACDPSACEGYILPDRFNVPWRANIGAALRFARSGWNVQPTRLFRDEPSVVVATELALTGATRHGYGQAAFAEQQLQRSGAHTSYSLRIGAEWEAVPGWVRIRAGSYWEPGRMDATNGRLHGTAGAQARLVQFWLWGQRRLAATVTLDHARGYQNYGVSLGFWH